MVDLIPCFDHLRQAIRYVSEEPTAGPEIVDGLRKMLQFRQDNWQQRLLEAEAQLHEAREQLARLEQPAEHDELKEIANSLNEIVMKIDPDHSHEPTKPALNDVLSTVSQLKTQIEEKLALAEAEQARLELERQLRPLLENLEAQFDALDRLFLNEHEDFDIVQLFKSMGVRIKTNESGDNEIVIHNRVANILSVLTVPSGINDYSVTNALWDRIVGSD